MKIRVKFGKEGALCYIGHLDVLRTFQKIFRRAEIPMAYSKGFSPHPIMSFALPLGLGLSSEGEYLDAELDLESGQSSLFPPEHAASFEAIKGLRRELMERLVRATSVELPVYDLRFLPEKCENAMASVGRALYGLNLNQVLTAPLEQAGKALLERESIPVEKKTKTRSLEMDLRPCIYRMSFHQNRLILELSAGSRANVKPEAVWELLLREANLPENLSPLSIRRLDLMTESGLSLGEVGEEVPYV